MVLKQNNPNFLFIMTDQHRFDYLSCAGASFLKTPNIDYIAKTGMLFTNCFTNSPICAPARIGLATGLQPSRMGALNNFSYLPLNVTTYYQRMRDYGYKVGCTGKLDLAKPSSFIARNGDRPCTFAHGFTHPFECEGKMQAGAHDTPRGPYGYYLEELGLYERFHEDYVKRAKLGCTVEADDDSVLTAEHFEDSYIGRMAVKWLSQVSNDYPWHYFVSFVGPHNPYDPPSDYAERLRDAEIPKPITRMSEKKPEWFKKRQTEAEIPEIENTRKQYCAAIELIDNQIGQILDAVEKRGLLYNTYIIFTSDHGDMLGDHGLYNKHVPYEASIHIPLIVAGPNISGGQTSDALIELIDLNPTVCDLAGIPLQPDIDAKSFKDLLFGVTNKHRENIVSGEYNYRCIRTQKYKYVHNYNDINELYDMENDPYELSNIVNENPEIVELLARTLVKRYMEGKWLW